MTVRESTWMKLTQEEEQTLRQKLKIWNNVFGLNVELIFSNEGSEQAKTPPNTILIPIDRGSPGWRYEKLNMEYEWILKTLPVGTLVSNEAWAVIISDFPFLIDTRRFNLEWRGPEFLPGIDHDAVWLAYSRLCGFKLNLTARRLKLAKGSVQYSLERHYRSNPNDLDLRNRFRSERIGGRTDGATAVSINM